MTMTDWLDLVTRIVGVLVALLGAVIGAPNGVGTYIVGGRARWRQVKRVVGRLRDKIRRRRSATVNAAAAVAFGSGGTLWGTGTAIGFAPPLTMQERLTVVEKMLDELRGNLDERVSELQAADAALGERIERLRSTIDRTASRILRRLDREAERSGRVDARALPLIGTGVLLTALSAEISGSGWVWWLVWMLLIGGGIALSLWVVTDDDPEAPTGRRRAA